jgi:hypothetical protein
MNPKERPSTVAFVLALEASSRVTMPSGTFTGLETVLKVRTERVRRRKGTERNIPEKRRKLLYNPQVFKVERL